MKPEPLDLETWRKEIISKAEKLEKEIKEGFKIKYDAFFVYIPGPKRLLELKRKDWEVARLYGMLKAIKEVKEKIKSACEFYLKYKDNPELLLKEHPKYKEKIENFRILKPLGNYIKGKYYDVDRYNKWLFKLAFKDVLEGDKDG